MIVRRWWAWGLALGLGACGDDPPEPSGADATSSEPRSTDATSSTLAPTTGTADTTDAPADSTGAPAPSGPCDATSSTALADCVDAAAYEADVQFVADLRTPGNPHWLEVQEMCADRLTMLGFDVILQDYGSGTNVLGFRAGTERPSEIVLVGAHYDHIADCIGADDNATGVAAILEVARILGPTPTPRTLGIACWDEEESGLIGSTAFVEIGLDPPAAVATYVNFDMIGIRRTEPNTQMIPAELELVFPREYAEVEADEFRGDFVVVLADTGASASASAFESHADARALDNIPLVLSPALATSPAAAELRRSDHAPFWDAGIPAMFLSDTGELRHPNYHCIGTPDVVEDLDVPFAVEIVAASVGAIADTLQ